VDDVSRSLSARRVLGSAAAAAVLLPLTACGLSDGPRPGSEPEAQGSPAASAQATSPASGTPEPAAAPSPPAAAPSPATAAPSSPAAPAPPPTPDPGAPLWGNEFLATRVTEQGRARPLVAGTELVVSFEQRDRVVAWRAGCNRMGAPVTVSPERLDVAEEVGGTAVGCDPERQAQDEWLTGFFRGDPWWELRGEVLLLQHGDTFFELRRQPTG
jgi:heat shock protein HslJ